MKDGNVRVNMEARDFDRLFEENMAKYPTYKAAYQATEKYHEILTGHRRYADHESYRVTRRSRLKKKRR